MNKPDFQIAAKETADKKYLPLSNWNDNDAPVHSRNFVADTNKGSFIHGFLAGCEHAYSLMEKENKELKSEIERFNPMKLYEAFREDYANSDYSRMTPFDFAEWMQDRFNPE